MTEEGKEEKKRDGKKGRYRKKKNRVVSVRSKCWNWSGSRIGTIVKTGLGRE